jgi:hypothetical protein
MALQCNGAPDCTDGSDESNCQQLMQYECADHTVLPLNALCDGKYQCPDRTDEQCAGWGYWKCYDGKRFVAIALACDGAMDCGDGSDELPAACDVRAQQP